MIAKAELIALESKSRNAFCSSPAADLDWHGVEEFARTMIYGLMNNETHIFHNIFKSVT